MEQEQIKSWIEKRIGWEGRMISGSKSGYRDRFPDNLSIFNANICSRDSKIWYGDIDITLSRQDLRELAVESATDIYVLYEMDARFENEDNPRIENFIYRANADGTEEIGKSYQGLYQLGETLTRK